MINLLPPDSKEAYHYGRRNRTLLRWISAGAISLFVGVLLVVGGYLYLNQSIHNQNQQIADSQKQLNAQHITDIQKQVSTMSGNLKLATQVLSKEILFSKLLKQLAVVTPNNTILTNLAITQTQGAIDITAKTASYSAATQLQVNLADPGNKIFSKADIVSINCSDSGGDDPLVSKYPCTASIRALFATNNPFLFINDQKGDKS